MSAPDPRGFRDFDAEARPSVRALYAEKHERQTLDYVLGKQEEYLPLRRERMSVWRAIERLSEIVDDSDPDIELTQLDHSLQTAESLRAQDAPRWLVLTGFLHDMGKVLCLFGEPQWAVVGDIHPVGCAFSPRIVHADLLARNPDARAPRTSSPLGIYSAGCGLDRVHMTWGHDEYGYQVLRPYLPEPALAIVRYHSFYAWHREGEYAFLTDGSDTEKLDHVQRFNGHDLYSKAETLPDWPSLRPWYEELVAEFLPDTLQW